MTTANEFIKDFMQDIIKADPMERYKLVAGWTKHLEARDHKNRCAVLEAAQSMEAENPGIVIGAKGWRKLAETTAGVIHEAPTN